MRKAPFMKPDGTAAWSVMSDDADEPVLVCETEDEADAFIASVEHEDAMPAGTAARASKEIASAQVRAYNKGVVAATVSGSTFRKGSKARTPNEHDAAAEAHMKAAAVNKRAASAHDKSAEHGKAREYEAKAAEHEKAAAGHKEIARDERGRFASDSALTSVRRVDTVGTLQLPVELPNGYLKVDAFLTRTGVFVYRNDDGTERREFRPPEEVFEQTSLDSFSMAPVTDDHPPEFLNAKNTGKYQRGHMSERIIREGKLMRGSMMITDASLISKMKSGRAQQISNGYTCDLEKKAGVTDSGEHYDFVQRKIRGNHVAVLERGRAGSEARVRMDAGADVVVSIRDGGNSAPNPPEGAPVKIRIDGVEYEAGSEQAVKAMEAWNARLAAEAKVRADADAARATADKAAAAELKAAKDAAEASKARADAEAEKSAKALKELEATPGKVAAEIKARMSLEKSAASILGGKFKFDGVKDLDVKIAALKKAEPELKIDGKSEAYVDARFDIAVENAAAEAAEDDDGEDGIDAARRVVVDDDGSGEPGDPANEMTEEEANKPHTDSLTAFEAMRYRHRNEWRKPIGNEAQQNDS